MPRGKLSKNQVKYTQLVASGMDEDLAVVEAGYKADRTPQIKYKLNNNQRILDRIEMLKQEVKTSKVATKADREAFWTDMMNDPKNSGNVRLEASKLLGKAQGDFIDRSKIETEVDVKPVMLIPEMSPGLWEKYWEDTNGC